MVTKTLKKRVEKLAVETGVAESYWQKRAEALKKMLAEMAENEKRREKAKKQLIAEVGEERAREILDEIKRQERAELQEWYKNWLEIHEKKERVFRDGRCLFLDENGIACECEDCLRWSM